MSLNEIKELTLDYKDIKCGLIKLIIHDYIITNDIIDSNIEFHKNEIDNILKSLLSYSVLILNFEIIKDELLIKLAIPDGINNPKIIDFYLIFKTKRG